jgi:hypothetical protein
LYVFASVAITWSLWTSALSSPGVLAVSRAVASFFRVSSTLGSSFGGGTLEGFVCGFCVSPRRRHFTYTASGFLLSLTAMTSIGVLASANVLRVVSSSAVQGLPLVILTILLHLCFSSRLFVESCNLSFLHLSSSLKQLLATVEG